MRQILRLAQRTAGPAGPSARSVAAGAAAASQPSGGRVALVQGSNRGIGLELVSQLLQRPDHAVVATCRTPSAAVQLQDLQRRHGRERLLLVPLDTGDEASIARAAEQVLMRTIRLACSPCWQPPPVAVSVNSGVFRSTSTASIVLTSSSQPCTPHTLTHPHRWRRPTPTWTCSSTPAASYTTRAWPRRPA